MPPRVEPSLEWVAPARWQLRPHISSMRIATYEIPHAPGDAENPELSITRAGGDLQVNADRWIAQFDAGAKATAKKTERTIAGVRALFVEVRGAYQGLDMAEPEPGFLLLGAIVDTPRGAHFFKLTGPAKSVEAARSARSRPATRSTLRSLIFRRIPRSATRAGCSTSSSATRTRRCGSSSSSSARRTRRSPRTRPSGSR